MAIPRSEYQQEYRYKNKEKVQEQTKLWKQNNKDKTKGYNLKANYGLSLDDYNAKYAEQEGCCSICHTHQLELTKSLHVDHCHTTGKIRGLLCFKCNTLLGKVNDNPEILASAINYLRVHHGT